MKKTKNPNIYILQGIVLTRDNIEEIERPMLINKKLGLHSFRVGLKEKRRIPRDGIPYILTDKVNNNTEVETYSLYYFRQNKQAVQNKHDHIKKWFNQK